MFFYKNESSKNFENKENKVSRIQQTPNFGFTSKICRTP